MVPHFIFPDLLPYNRRKNKEEDANDEEIKFLDVQSHHFSHTGIRRKPEGWTSKDLNNVYEDEYTSYDDKRKTEYFHVQ
jgi:hypothetical protein